MGIVVANAIVGFIIHHRVGSGEIGKVYVMFYLKLFSNTSLLVALTDV